MKYKYMLMCFLCLSLSNKSISQEKLKKTIPDKLVVLTFDDASKSHYTNVAPLLKKYGFGGTFYVCEFPPNFNDTSKYMSWQQIKGLSEMGFEIGNHTQHHVHMEALSKDQLVAEIAYIEKKCDSLKIPEPVSFAYPGYGSTSDAEQVLKSMGYRTARAGGEQVYHPQTDDPLNLPSFTPGNNLQIAISSVKLAKEGKVVVLTIHGVPDTAHNWVNTDPDVFIGLLNYLARQHYKVIAMRDLPKYLKEK